MNRVLLTVLILSFSISGMSQDDSTNVKVRKNIIRWNITPMAVVGPRSLVLGYERVLKNNQSISINVGYLELSPFTNREGEPIQFFDDVKRGGFDVTLDYRFYFKNRNKYPAPDGLYWGPFASVYNLNFEGKSTIFDDFGNKANVVGINASLTMYNLGAQLGYQFIIKDRFSVDLILMGPSFTRYAFKLGFDAEIPLDEDDPFYQDMEALLKKLIPGSEIILDGAEFSANGKTHFNYVGYRYGIHLGYVF